MVIQGLCCPGCSTTGLFDDTRLRPASQGFSRGSGEPTPTRSDSILPQDRPGFFSSLSNHSEASHTQSRCFFFLPSKLAPGKRTSPSSVLTLPTSLQGCDASVLIDSTEDNIVEKDAVPNLTLRGFDLIDETKALLESICKGIISCVDILALATRDAVAMLGGPEYPVPIGRRDGLVSKIDDVNIPGPTFSIDAALSAFESVGLNLKDLVTLLGAHTIGFAHCGFFNDRVYDFQDSGMADPPMDPTLVTSMKKVCPPPDQITDHIRKDPKDAFRDSHQVLPSIDDGNIENQLVVVEYVEDIYKLYRTIEDVSCVPPDYMRNQVKINSNMRAVVIDWLVEVHLELELMPETLYLTVNIIDRYLSIQSIARKNLPLLAIAAMFIARKYEEVCPPHVNDFIRIFPNECTSEQIVAMESTILKKLNFKLTVPTRTYVFLRFLKAADSNKVVPKGLSHALHHTWCAPQFSIPLWH